MAVVRGGSEFLSEQGADFLLDIFIHLDERRPRAFETFVGGVSSSIVVQQSESHVRVRYGHGSKLDSAIRHARHCPSCLGDYRRNSTAPHLFATARCDVHPRQLRLIELRAPLAQGRAGPSPSRRPVVRTCSDPRAKTFRRAAMPRCGVHLTPYQPNSYWFQFESGSIDLFRCRRLTVPTYPNPMPITSLLDGARPCETTPQPLQAIGCSSDLEQLCVWFSMFAGSAIAKLPGEVIATSP